MSDSPGLNAVVDALRSVLHAIDGVRPDKGWPPMELIYAIDKANTALEQFTSVMDTTREDAQ